MISDYPDIKSKDDNFRLKNFLRLNYNKTKFIIYFFNKKKYGHLSVKMDKYYYMNLHKISKNRKSNKKLKIASLKILIHEIK